MTAKNDITGDRIASRNSNEEYAKGWDRIFNKKKDTNKNKGAPPSPDKVNSRSACKSKQIKAHNSLVV